MRIKERCHETESDELKMSQHSLGWTDLPLTHRKLQRFLVFLIFPTENLEEKEHMWQHKRKEPQVNLFSEFNRA